MAIITLSAGTCLPASALGVALAEALPRWRWTCGDDIVGGGGLQAWRRHQMICGRADDEPLFLELDWRDEPWAGPSPQPPRHVAHLVLGRPTTDERAIAERLLVVVATEILRTDAGGNARVRFEDDGPWLDLATLEDLAPLLAQGERLVIEDQGNGNRDEDEPEAGATGRHRPFDDMPPHERSALLGRDVIVEAQAQRALARTQGRMGLSADRDPVPDFLDETPRADRLPTLAVLFDAAPAFDRALLAEGLALLDPHGGWEVGEEHGLTIARTPRFAVTLAWRPEPLPEFLVELALWRSFWCTGGENLRRIRRHGGHLAITCDLDTAGRPEEARQAAKAMALALAVAARDDALAGFYNAAHDCVWASGDLNRLTNPLGADEVPIPLFVWTTFHDTAPDAVSVSTAGMLPFTGYEIEAWNAPGSVDWVGKRLSDVLRYLLAHGPCVGHGETIGRSLGDRGVRCFHGASRAERDSEVAALLLEFSGPPGDEAGQPPIAAPPAIRPSVAGPPRRFTGFGRKGL
ncbi:MAG: DUF4261 domain-containing protein [Sphingomonadales bacterium]|nr:DUF4261 domain-containing protein [Sphingomonadales bacterium]